MNTSWLSLLGGGVAASATLAAGITVSGIAGAPAAPDKVVYVEQPVLIVPGAPETLPGPVRDQLIAILPAPQVAAAADPVAPAADPAAPSTDPAPIALPAPAGGEDEDGEDGEYEDGEDEGGEHEGGEGEDD